MKFKYNEKAKGFGSQELRKLQFYKTKCIAMKNAININI